MKKKIFRKKLFLITVFIFLFFPLGFVFAQYDIEIDVFSGGGGDDLSTNYYLFSLMGQPSAIGTSSSSGYRNYAGFIWALVGIPPINLCKGDFDGDGDVDGSDLAIFAVDFGRTNCSIGPPCEGDFDKDGDVDESDLAVFASEFGRTDC